MNPDCVEAIEIDYLFLRRWVAVSAHSLKGRPVEMVEVWIDRVTNEGR